jgi:hypothetical protein
VHITKPAGFKVTVTPDKFTIKPGKSVTYQVTITRTTAPLDTYAFGQLVWKDQRGHSVRSPISVQPVALNAPSTFAGTGASGSGTLTLASGYTGTLTTSVAGLAQASVTSVPLVVDDAAPFNPNAPATSDATTRVDATVPAGTPLARFATFAADYAAGTDVDVFVYQVGSGGALTLVGQSAGSTAEESVTLSNPSGGYAMFVNVFASPTPSVTVKPNVFVVGGNAGNLTATPTSQAVTTGHIATVTLTWSGLAAGRYLGIVSYSDGTHSIGSTVVSITN